MRKKVIIYTFLSFLLLGGGKFVNAVTLEPEYLDKATTKYGIAFEGDPEEASLRLIHVPEDFSFGKKKADRNSVVGLEFQRKSTKKAYVVVRENRERRSPWQVSATMKDLFLADGSVVDTVEAVMEFHAHQPQVFEGDEEQDLQNPTLFKRTADIEQMDYNHTVTLLAGSESTVEIFKQEGNSEVGDFATQLTEIKLYLTGNIASLIDQSICGKIDWYLDDLL